MEDPVDDAKDQGSNQVGGDTRNIGCDIRDMYNIYSFHGQPEDDCIDH